MCILNHTLFGFLIVVLTTVRIIKSILNQTSISPNSNTIPQKITNDKIFYYPKYPFPRPLPSPLVSPKKTQFFPQTRLSIFKKNVRLTTISFVLLRPVHYRHPHIFLLLSKKDLSRRRAFLVYKTSVLVPNPSCHVIDPHHVMCTSVVIHPAGYFIHPHVR